MKLRFTLSIAAAFAAFTMAAASGPPAKAVPPASASADDLVLATVNDHAIKARDVVSLFNNRHAGHAKFLGGDVEARKFLDIMIDDRLLIDEAYALRIDELAEVEQLVSEYARLQMSKYFVATEIDEKVRTTPEEVREVWEKWLNSYVHAQHVVVTSRAEAEQVRASILAGADIAGIARSCSVAASRNRGGHVMAGWGRFPPEWEKAVFALEPGQVTAVLEIDGLYEVVQLGARVDVPVPGLEAVSKKIDDELFKRKLAARRVEVAAALCQKYGVTFTALDYSPRLLLKLLETAPSAPVATWNGGNLSVAQAFTKEDLSVLASRDPVEARRQIGETIRATVNSPLIDLEAKNLKLDEAPRVAPDIERYRDYIVEALLYREHIFKDLTVKQEELEAYYQANRAEFVRPEKRRIAQILAQTEADAARVQKLAAEGADFAALAKQYSRDMVTASTGGDLGWVPADKVPQGFEPVFQLQNGAVASPLRSSAGWHVFKIVDTQPAGTPPFAEVASEVEKKLLERKKRDARAFWVEKLRGASEIRIDDAAIAAFVKANESAAPPPQHSM